MAGKKGRSGRPRGSLSWTKNPVALAGHRLNILIEMWLAGVPLPTRPGRWLVQPTERRHTVPPKIKRVLAEMAIRHVLFLDAESPAVRYIGVDDVLTWSRRRAPNTTLRRKPKIAGQGTGKS
jgi:hypothetical protein